MRTASELLEQAGNPATSRCERTASREQSMRRMQFDFRAIAITFWQRPPTSKGKPKHCGWPARMRSGQWNKDNKSSNHSRLGPPIRKQTAELVKRRVSAACARLTPVALRGVFHTKPWRLT